MKKLKTVFFATPDFAVPSLDILHNHPHIEVISVISMPDRKQGRGMELHSPEVIQYAKSNKIPYFQTENINKNLDYFKTIETADLFVVLAFAQFLSDDILNMPTEGCFNIHTSLLPKYRGAAPIQYALLNGDSSTGVSIQKMVKKMDAGDIAFEKSVHINPTETGGQLYTRLKFFAAQALNEFVYDILNKTVKYRSQNEADVSFAPTLKREDGLLDFASEEFTAINNKVRALFPWPGTYCFLNKKRLKVYTIEKSDIKLSPGEVHTSYNQLCVGCKDGSLRILSLQLEGKKACSDTELLNGIKGDIIINDKE